MLRQKDVLTEARQGLGKSQGQPCVDSLHEHFHRPPLEDAERAHEQQCPEHRRYQCDDHDWLDGKGEGVHQLLHGERHDEREEADRDRVGDDNGENAALEPNQQIEAREDGPGGGCGDGELGGLVIHARARVERLWTQCGRLLHLCQG